MEPTPEAVAANTVPAPLPPEVPAVPVAEVDTGAAEAQAAIEAPSNVVPLHPDGIPVDANGNPAPNGPNADPNTNGVLASAAVLAAAPEKTLEQQIADAEQHLAMLESQRDKTAVSELELDPDALSLVAKQRAEQRYPRAWKEVEKHLKTVAWSGETVAYLEPTSPIFNERLVKDLVERGFRAKIISLGANAGFKIEVKWGRK
jgi:hypothetical protein